MNDSLTAMRFADQVGLLSYYAMKHKKDEDDIRDNYICSFGLDPNGKRSWTLSDKIMTASVNKDLTVTLTDEEGTEYRSMPEIGFDADYERVVKEYRDLEENILPTAGVRNARIFDDFLSGRRRTATDWKKNYMGNGLLRILAERIVWDQDGSTFILDENGQPVTADGTLYTITDARIAVAHPMEMGKAVTETWQRYVLEHRLKQPFEQVWEPAYKEDDLKADRFKGYLLPVSRIINMEQHGIHSYGFKYYSDDYGFTLTDCELSYEDLGGYYFPERDNKLTLGEFSFDKLTRYVNHIVYLFDKWTISDRIAQDDASVAGLLHSFTLPQIMEFMKLAEENDAVSVKAILMDHKNKCFPDADPMAIFVLD
jgi:hypothetical protein